MLTARRETVRGRGASERLMTATQVAAWIGVHVGTVRLWARLGRIPVLRLSARTIRYDPEAVRAALGLPK